MIVECSISTIQSLIGRQVTLQELEDSLFLLKAEIERVEGDSIDIEINPDRPDMLSSEGIARVLRAFMNLRPGCPQYPITKSHKEIHVGKGLEEVRPYIACGIVRDVVLTDSIIKEYMHLQESLTSTHGRNRRKASIGLYVYNDIEFPVRYELHSPDEIRFVPLGHDVAMDGPTILTRHDKGILYGPIIAHFERWPLLVDAHDKTLSLPPIINSNDLGRVTETTHDLFVEVTGTHLTTVNQVLNIMITNIAERGGRVESVTIVYPDGKRIETPDLRPQRIRIKSAEVRKIIGLNLTDEQICECLRRMCYDARIMRRGTINVDVPAFRTDVMHPIDVFEDVAIGYGFDKITPTFPRTMTVGRLLPMTITKNKVRDLMIGAGYQEIMSYVMSSPEILCKKMLRERPLVITGNPKSRDYSVLRNSLLPVLLDFLAQNQHAELPHYIFEVGDVVVPAADTETRSLQRTAVCALLSDSRVNLTMIMNHLNFLLTNLGLGGKFRFEVADAEESFIKGRAGQVVVDEQIIGHFGEVAPQVLENFNIERPVVAFEIYLSNREPPEP